MRESKHDFTLWELCLGISQFDRSERRRDGRQRVAAGCTVKMVPMAPRYSLDAVYSGLPWVDIARFGIMLLVSTEFFYRIPFFGLHH